MGTQPKADLLKQLRKLNTARLEDVYLQVYSILQERDAKVEAKSKKKQPPEPALAGEPTP